MTVIYELSCESCDVSYLSMTLYPEMQRCPTCDKWMKAEYKPKLNLKDLENNQKQNK
jgi:hypothetical protein